MSKKVYFLIAMILLVLLSIRFEIYFGQAPKLKNGQELMFVTRLREEPEVKSARAQFRVRTADGERINITTGLSPQLHYGDEIAIKGKVKSSVYKGHEFFTMYFPTLQIINNDQNFIAAAATQIRRGADILYKKSLPPTSAGLLSGIVFGGDQGLPAEFMDALRAVGVIHVIAASGMNVTFVAGALIAVLGTFLKRQIAITIAIFGVMFYAFLSGLDASIVRASIMSIIAFSASLLGRQNFALASVYITAFIMLYFSPFLISDIGFQLSFMSTLGILLIKPVLDGGLGKLGRLGELGGENLTTTIAAQVATVPILLSVFGNYGLLSVFVNAIVLWTVPALMVLGGLGLIAGFIFEPLGKLVLFLGIPILFYFEKIVLYFGNLGWTVSIPELSPAVWIGYYMILGGCMLFLRQKQNSKIVRPIVDKLTKKA